MLKPLSNKASGMAGTMKRSVIGFCLAFGNMFLAHGIDFALTALFDFLSNFGNIVQMQIPTVILLYALQLALNIVLHFAVLKKQFQPVKERKPLFYFLLTVTVGAVWTGSFFIFKALVLNDIIEVNLWENYPETLLGFLPLILMFTIPLSVIYYALFRKRVGELFYFYTLSISLIATMPIVLVLTFPFD